jgi:transcription initiation factor TFIID TATA-box-binding protein
VTKSLKSNLRLQAMQGTVQKLPGRHCNLQDYDKSNPSPTAELQVEIQNVVATGNLGQNLDLHSVLKVSPGAEYNAQRFPGLVYKLKKPKTSSLLFTSGKIICLGAKSERAARSAIRRVVSELRLHGIVIIGAPEVKIENIVATGDLNVILDLEAVAERLTKTIYEPEQFPGLIYRMDEPKAVFLIFTSGKLVITGAKTAVEVRLAVNKLLDTLRKNGIIAYDELAEGYTPYKIALITLVESGNEEQIENVSETIRRELESNSLWRKWQIEKIAILETTGHEQPIAQSP